jgi:hypothetical protein
MWRGVVATTGTPGLHEVVAGVHVVDVTRPADLAVALRDGDGPVLVSSHPVHAHAARVACTVAEADDPDLPVAHTAFSQAPLAGLLAMAIARDIARDAGHGAAVWRDLSDAIWSAAVVPGVARLPHPNPSLKQHVRSMFPGSRYLVRLHPEPEALGSKQVAAALAPVGRGNVHVYSTRLDPQDQLLSSILGQVAPRGVDLREVPGTWASLFGRTEDLQLAMIPADFQQMLRPRGTACRSCGLSTSETACTFCRMRVRSAEDELRVLDTRKNQQAGSTRPLATASGRTT